MQNQKNAYSDGEKLRVRILLRVSSDQQLEANGDLTVQRALVMDYIKKHDNWILDEKEYFEGGVSGYKNSVSERNVLQEALKDAEKKEYDILVIYKDDRLGRRMLELPNYVMSLKAFGVDVYTAENGILTPSSNDPMDIMPLIFRYSVAEKHSKDTGTRVRDTAKKLVTRGKFMGGKAPYGYVLEHSGEISKHGRMLKKLVIYPEHADVVKYIYDLSLTKEYGSTKIAKILNLDDNYKSLAPNDFWRSGTITSILTNPIYTGYVTYNRRERLNGRHRNLNKDDWTIAETSNPDITIIDEATWQKVQDKRVLRNAKYTKSLENQNVTIIKRNDGMLSLVDVLHCGYCNCKMVNGSKYNYWTIKSTGERRTNKIAIYKCQNAWQGIPHNPTKQYRADHIEPIVYRVVADYISSLAEKEHIFEDICQNSNKEIEKIEKVLIKEKETLKKIEKSISILEDKIPDAITGEYILSIEDLMHNINKQKEKARTQTEIINIKEKELSLVTVTKHDWENVKAKLPTWNDMLLNADVSTKRVLINKLINRIEITKERIVIQFKINLDDFFSQPRMSKGFGVPEQRL